MNRATDAERFADEVMAPLYLTFRERPDAAVTAAYFVGLADLDFEGVLGAARRAIQMLKFFPKVAELRELAGGSLDDQAALAWSRVYRNRARGYFRPIDFEDPKIHATVTAMGGWREIHGLSSVDTEAVEAAVKRKEFIQLYKALAVRGIPSDTPAALCAGRWRDEEPLRLSSVSDSPPLPAHDRKALPAGGPTVTADRVRSLLDDLAKNHRPPEPVAMPRVVERPAERPPTHEELAEHERRKREMLQRFHSTMSAPPDTANGTRP